MLAHGGGPVLVVAETDECLVGGKRLSSQIKINVGPVRHVEAELFHLIEHGELVAKEVSCSLLPVLGVGAIEGDDGRSF